MTTWYPMDRKRDYEEVMIAWVQALTLSPMVFPPFVWDRKIMVREILHVLDAHLQPGSGNAVLTDGKGSWVVCRRDTYYLVWGSPSRDALIESVRAFTVPVVTVHSGDAWVEGVSLRPWRLFQSAPSASMSRAAVRRRAKVLVRLEDLGLA